MIGVPYWARKEETELEHITPWGAALLPTQLLAHIAKTTRSQHDLQSGWI